MDTEKANAATKLWLGGAPIQDIQALVGSAVAVEDAIRMRILEAAQHEPDAVLAVSQPETTLAAVETAPAPAPAPTKKVTRSANGKREWKPTRRPFVDAIKPEPPKATGPVLDLTGYPAQLQRPIADKLRMIWDALVKSPTGMTVGDLADELTRDGRLRGDDPERAISNGLYAMRQKELVERTDDRPARWKVVA